MMKDKVVCADTGMFLLRLGLGIVFAYHGWGKLQAMADTVGYFGMLGLAPFFAYLVAWVELLGGAAMILGVCTKWAGILLAITMAVAAYYAKTPAGFMSYELPLSLFFTAAGVAFAGPGSFTVHKLWGGK